MMEIQHQNKPGSVGGCPNYYFLCQLICTYFQNESLTYIEEESIGGGGTYTSDITLPSNQQQQDVDSLNNQNNLLESPGDSTSEELDNSPSKCGASAYQEESCEESCDNIIELSTQECLNLVCLRAALISYVVASSGRGSSITILAQLKRKGIEMLLVILLVSSSLATAGGSEASFHSKPDYCNCSGLQDMCPVPYDCCSSPAYNEASSAVLTQSPENSCSLVYRLVCALVYVAGTVLFIIAWQCIVIRFCFSKNNRESEGRHLVEVPFGRADTNVSGLDKTERKQKELVLPSKEQRAYELNDDQVESPSEERRADEANAGKKEQRELPSEEKRADHDLNVGKNDQTELPSEKQTADETNVSKNDQTEEIKADESNIDKNDQTAESNHAEANEGKQKQQNDVDVATESVSSPTESREGESIPLGNVQILSAHKFCKPEDHHLKGKENEAANANGGLDDAYIEEPESDAKMRCVHSQEQQEHVPKPTAVASPDDVARNFVVVVHRQRSARLPNRSELIFSAPSSFVLPEAIAKDSMIVVQEQCHPCLPGGSELVLIAPRSCVLPPPPPPVDCSIVIEIRKVGRGGFVMCWSLVELKTDDELQLY